MNQADDVLAEPRSFSAQLWASATSAYSAILEHPFLTGLADGSLDRRSFEFYVVQDTHYLQGFARALALLAARAPTESETGLLAGHAAAVIGVERALHAGLLTELTACGEVSADSIAPTTLAYSNYLVATCATRPFSDGVAAVLPCYWIYRELGRTLLPLSSPDPLYARWIQTYGGDEFDQAVEEMLKLTDSIGAQLGACDRTSALDHFGIASRYEWMFWDAAYRREEWPV